MLQYLVTAQNKVMCGLTLNPHIPISSLLLHPDAPDCTLVARQAPRSIKTALTSPSESSVSSMTLSFFWYVIGSLLHHCSVSTSPHSPKCSQLFEIWFIFAWIVRKTCTVSCSHSRDYFNFCLCFPVGNSNLCFYFGVDCNVLKNLIIFSLPNKIISSFIIAHISKQKLNVEWTTICWFNGHCQKWEVYFCLWLETKQNPPPAEMFYMW